MYRWQRAVLSKMVAPMRRCSDRVMVRFSEDIVKEATADWVKSFVVRLGLCPWAAGEVANGLHITVYSEGSVHEQYSESEYQQLLDALISQIEGFKTSSAASAMIVVPPLREFEEFLMVHNLLEEELDHNKLSDHVQVATFHPQYQFSDTLPTDPSNFTNRSPFPTFHLLRVSAVTKAIESYGDMDEIWRKNVATTKSLGSEHLLKMNAEILQKVVKGSKSSLARK